MKCFLPIAAVLCFALVACNQNPDNNNEFAADSSSFRSGSSSAAMENNTDTVHKFIRTADLKFKVSNVEKVIYHIEDIINSHGGYVTHTQLNSNIDNVLTTAVSEDSSLETTLFTVTSTMTLRVPNSKLDTTLKDIAKLVDYLDYRIIKADDISLQIHANNLEQKRGDRHAARIMHAIESHAKKLGETTGAEALLQHTQEQSDNDLLANISLNDQVNFSTVQLSIYQRQAIKRELIPTNKNIAAYEPGFGTKVLDALQYGLGIFESIFMGLLQLWPLFLIGFVGWMMYKRFQYKFKNVNRKA